MAPKASTSTSQPEASTSTSTIPAVDVAAPESTTATDAGQEVPQPAKAKAPVRNDGQRKDDPHRTHIHLNDHVMFELPSKAIKLIRLTPDTTVVNLGKFGSFPAGELIGQPYGVTFEVIVPIVKDEQGNTVELDIVDEGKRNGKWKNRQPKGKAAATPTIGNGTAEEDSTAPANSRPLCSIKQLKGLGVEEIEGPGSTNENILATGAKTLSHEDIMAMKKQGLSGQEIIERQIAQHEQFALKNEYSKAKYKSRKESKFLKYFTPLPPTVHNLCQYYFQHDPKKIRDLRPDTLAQMLALANIRPGSRVVVVDDASGLVVGAIAERMAGHGQILLLHQHDSPPPVNLAAFLNLPSSFMHRKVLKVMHWGHTDENWVSADPPMDEERAPTSTTDGTDTTMQVTETSATAPLSANTTVNTDTIAAVQTGTDGAPAPTPGEKVEREKSKVRKKREAKRQHEEVLQEFRDGEYDALIACSQYEPLSIVRKLINTLGGSAQIVLHSPVIEPLSDAVQALMHSGTALNPTIIEPWLRQYQVLPGRTHPEMNGTAHGGYIMHATRILDEGIVGHATGGRKKRGRR